ncbi:MAG: PHP domain-containing protein [Ruminococcaceae bacterium]|nr:PHP domain-containing protein [Oscillospiraceae bacterium]
METKELLYQISRTDITAKERLDALRLIREKVDNGEIETPERGVFVNNHIHTSYSFSPYTPTSAVFYAWKAGLRTAGIMDHDSVGGLREFIEAGEIMGMPTTCGVECRVNVEGTSLVGKKINNPDQKSCAYLAMHGIPHQNIEKIEAVLAPLREKRNERNRIMCAKINEITADAGIVLDFDKDVYPLSMAHEGGSVTERHVCCGLTKKITAAYPDREKACDFIEKLTGVKLGDKTREKLITAPDNFYEYDILGVLKGHLVGKFYVDATDECMNIREFTALAKEMGAISAYAYLGDVGESPTGDKKAQKFEDDYIEELFDVLRDCGFSAVTYMPSRNTKEQLRRVMDLCHERGLYEISGEDINSPRQSFICPALADEAYSHLRVATYALIGHEKAASECKCKSMFSDETKAAHPTLEERVEIYSKLGGYEA